MKCSLGITLAVAASVLTQVQSKEFELQSLDHTIQVQEAIFSDIRKGTEKHVKWYKGREVTRYAFVYLHGFSASRQEITPVTEQLAQRIGANVFYTRFRGHGRSDDAMAEASVAAWKQDAMEAFRVGQVIGNEIILISTSTGSTIGTWLLSQSKLACSEKTTTGCIRAHIATSPNFALASKLANIAKWPLGVWLMRMVEGDYRSFEPQSELHKYFWTYRYPTQALAPLVKIVDEVQHIDKLKINLPQLFIYSPSDKVIDLEEISNTAEALPRGTVTLYPFSKTTDRSNHVLAGYATSPETIEEMVGIMYNYLVSIGVK